MVSYGLRIFKFSSSLTLGFFLPCRFWLFCFCYVLVPDIFFFQLCFRSICWFLLFSSGCSLFFMSWLLSQICPLSPVLPFRVFLFFFFSRIYFSFFPFFVLPLLVTFVFPFPPLFDFGDGPELRFSSFPRPFSFSLFVFVF